MKLLILLSIVAFCSAVPAEDNIRVKRGIIGYPALSYSSQFVHHAPSIPVAYHAPIVKYVAPIKVIQPYPITKIISPAVSYTKLAYPSYYGYGFGHFH